MSSKQEGVMEPVVIQTENIAFPKKDLEQAAESLEKPQKISELTNTAGMLRFMFERLDLPYTNLQHLNMNELQQAIEAHQEDDVEEIRQTLQEMLYPVLQENRAFNLLNQSPEKVAESIIGKILVRYLENGEVLKVLIKEVLAYAATDNTAKKYQQIEESDAGKVFVTHAFGNPVTNISTAEGGCVTLEVIQSEGETIKGKGRVSNFLQTKSFKERETPVDITNHMGEFFLEV